jgi:hypothetical protein
MNLRPALKISLELLPAEQALRRAETHEELADAWWIHCDNFNSARREYLQEVHNEVLKGIMLRHARTL